ncbi:MAG: N-acylglucosamine 2-epimerase [Planctomycetes bacterium]|nr:N-acylglucosamine 2-epimerase [Planctomycetota bacterium]
MNDKANYSSIYRHGLLHDTIPFWLKHGMDAEHGGVFTSLGRDGSLLDSDKAVWPQGRFAWMLATMFNTVEPRAEWREAALSCLGFLERHGFDSDGRMFFLLTREGQPVRKRRYAYSEAFACLAYAACSKATGREDFAQRATELFTQFTTLNFKPGNIPPKTDQETRPSKGIGPLMICINMAQTLRDNIDFPDAQRWIDRCIDEIERDFCQPAHKVVMETVSPSGGIIDHLDSRLLNPGHAIEAAGFILHESLHRGGDARLTQLGVQMLDWMWERGWDQDFGGILYFRDLHDKPIQEYWHDMKFWWPQNEAIIATLLAYKLTGDERHAQRHALVHDWAHEHFPDPEFGEWFGYLHRNGSVASEMKGGHWKGPFHLPRMQWYCWQLLEEQT